MTRRQQFYCHVLPLSVVSFPPLNSLAEGLHFCQSEAFVKVKLLSIFFCLHFTLEIVLGQKKLLDGRNGPFGDNVFKNPARLFFVLFFCYFFITLP